MNQKFKIIFRRKAHKTIAMLLSLAMLLAMIPSFALRATAISAMTVALNKPQMTDTNNTRYTFSNATMVNNDSITSITLSATNGTVVDSLTSSPTPSSILSSIDGTTRVYTYVFENGISSAAAQSFIRGVVFHYVAGSQIGVTVDANKTVLPTGANITKFVPPDDVSHQDHYYMFVPFSGSTALSWSEAYNAAKTYRYMGMVGYLATITSQAEDTVLDNISMNGGWSGGSRDTADTYDGATAPSSEPNNYFKWCCGPEAGQSYYYYRSSTDKNAVALAYNGFKEDSGEPNNYDGQSESTDVLSEWCMQIHHPYGSSGGYTWNDLADNITDTSGAKYVQGYFVEFSNYTGGMDAAYSSDKTAVNLYNIGTSGITHNAAVTLNTPVNLQYDGTEKACTANINGAVLVSGTDYTLTYKGRNGTSYTDSTIPPKNAGDYTVTFALTAGGQAKCSVEGTPSADFTITPATLTVTPSSGQSKLFGTVDPLLAYSCSGNISGEIPAFSGALSRNSGEATGDYTITQGNLALTDGSGGFLAGNYSLALSPTTINFKVNAFNPTERATLSTPNGDNGWFKASVTDIILTAPAGFTISTTGIGDWTSSINMDKSDGTGKTIDYYLKRTSDGAISGVVTSDSYKVDTTLPANITISYGTSSFKEFLNTITFGLFFKDTVTVTLTATDPGSGVKEFKYTLDAAEQTIPATNGSATFVIQPQYKGNISGVKAIDNAGNESTQKTTENFIVDHQNPTVPTADTNGYTPGSWTKDDVKLTVSGSSAQSGITKYQYSTDNGSTWSDMTTTEQTAATDKDPYNAVKAELTIGTDMNGSVLLRAVSNSGNGSDSTSVSVKRDTVIPNLTVGITGTVGQWTDSPVTFTLSNKANNPSPVTYWVKIGSADWTQLSGNTYNATGNVNTTYQFKAVSASGLASSVSDTYTVKLTSDVLKEVIKDIDNLPDPSNASDKDITDNEQSIKDTKILYDTLSKDEETAVGQSRIDKLNQLISRLKALLVIIPKDADTGITAGNIGTSVKVPELNDPEVGKVVVKLAVDPISPSSTHSGNFAIASTSLGQSGTNLLAAFDVSLIKSVFDAAGNQTSTGKVNNASITGPITVRIPVPAGYQGRTDLQVVYIDDSGNVTPFTTTLVTIDGVEYLQFTTTHFSVYAITAPVKTPAASNPKTGSGTGGFPVIPLALFGMSSAAGLVIIRKQTVYRVKK